MQRMENMEIDILNKMEQNGKSLNLKWMKNNEETEQKILMNVRQNFEKLEHHDAKLLDLKERMFMNEKGLNEYQEGNDAKVENINRILERLVLCTISITRSKKGFYYQCFGGINQGFMLRIIFQLCTIKKTDLNLFA